MTGLSRRLAAAGAGLSSAWVVVLPAMALALGLGLNEIGSRNLWLDEATSWTFARIFLQRLPELPDINMNLYYWLLALWGQLVPIDNEAGLRGLSLVFTVLTVPAIYLLTRRVFGHVAAAAATLLFALDPVAIRFAQETRGYSLLILLSVVSTYLFVSARASRSWFMWFTYGAVSAVALYNHFFAGFVIVAHGVVLLIEERWRMLRPRPIFAYGLFSMGAAPLAVGISARGGCQIEWIPPPTVQLFLTGVREIGGVPGIVLLAAYLTLAAFAARAVRAAIDRPQHRTGTLLLVAWFGVPIVASLAISLVQPLFVLRYITVSLPPLIILAALGITTIRPRVIGVLVLVGVVAVQGLSLREWYAGEGTERWQQVTSHIVTRSQPWDGVIFQTRSGRKPFAFYVQKLGATRQAPTEVWTPKQPCSDATRQEQVAYEAELTSLAGEAMRLHERVWLIASHTEIWDPPSELVALYAELEGTHALAERATFGENPRSGHFIEVRLYVRRDRLQASARLGGGAP